MTPITSLPELATNLKEIEESTQTQLIDWSLKNKEWIGEDVQHLILVSVLIMRSKVWDKPQKVHKID